MWVIFLVARMVPRSFVDLSPKLRVLSLGRRPLPKKAKIWPGGRKTARRSYPELGKHLSNSCWGHLGIARKGGGVSTLARMVWGNFFGKNLLDFGGVGTPAKMVWGTFFGDKVPQSARLSAGRGVRKLFAQMPPA